MSLTTLLVIMKYMNRPKSAAVKDIDIADILGQKYRPTSNIEHSHCSQHLLRLAIRTAHTHTITMLQTPQENTALTNTVLQKSHSQTCVRMRYIRNSQQFTFSIFNSLVFVS